MTNPRSSQAPLTLHASLETGTPALAPPGGAGTQSPAVCGGTAAAGEPKRAGVGANGGVANGTGLPAVQSEAAAEGPWSRELIKQIAMDIGKEVVAYIEVMYPQAITATSSTFKLSVRNCIHNQIMAAIEITDEGQIKSRLQDRKRFRRQWTAQYRKIRKARPVNTEGRKP